MCQKFTADEPNTMDHRKAHQSETAKGLAYSINQEEYLKVFLTDGEVPIDDSASERTLWDSPDASYFYADIYIKLIHFDKIFCFHFQFKCPLSIFR